MPSSGRFDNDTLDALKSGKILGIRAGSGNHRFIGVWMVVVENRLFIRSWTVKPAGWFSTFLEEPRGTMQIGNREIPIRAIRTRSERLKSAVDRAYAVKYNTKASLKYVRGFKQARRRNSTTELAPL